MIELLLYVVLVSSLLTSVSLFLISVLEHRVKNTLIQEVYGQSSFAVEVINQKIRNAETITSPTIGLNSNSLVLVVSGVTTTFDLSSGVLRITEGLEGPVNLTNDGLIISNLNFNNFSRVDTEGAIQTSFDVDGSSESNRQEFNFNTSFQTSASLRSN